MKFRVYSIISEAVDTGIEFGINRAYKHTDKPTTESIKNNLNNEIMLALSEVINFDESE